MRGTDLRWWSQIEYLQPDGLQLVQRLGVGDALELRHRVAPSQRHRLVGRDDDLGRDVDAAVAAVEDVEARVRRRLLLPQLRVGGARPEEEASSRDSVKERDRGCMLVIPRRMMLVGGYRLCHLCAITDLHSPYKFHREKEW